MARHKNTQQADEGPAAKGAARRPQVTLDLDLARKVGAVASLLDLTVPEYVNARLRPIVEQELATVLREMGLAEE